MNPSINKTVVNDGDLAVWRTKWRGGDRFVLVEVISHTPKRVKCLVRFDGVPIVRYLRVEKLDRARGGLLDVDER